MAWYEIFYKPKNNEDMKEKTLYELFSNPEWKEKWCKRNPRTGQIIEPYHMPLTSPLGRAIISSPIDGPKLAESTYAHRQGQSKPFSLSKETMSIISKL